MRLLVFALLFLSHFLTAQVATTPLFTGNFQQQPVDSLIALIEKESPYKFYFEHSWMDSLTVTLQFKEEPIDFILAEAFKGSLIRFYLFEEKVILTQNAYINDDIDPNLFAQVNEVKRNDASTFNYSFRREYIESESIASGDAEKIIEIGIKSETKNEISPRVFGYVKEGRTGEPLTGALVYVDNSSNGTTTNNYGFYSLTTEPGPQTIVIRYSGFKTIKQQAIVFSDGKFDARLEDDVITLKEVTVESERDENILGVQTGVTSIDVKTMKNVPKVLGENDVLKVALTLPGVKSVGEGSIGINVRGGNADHNLIQLDEATIYNSSHFLGFFSIFNSDALKSSELLKTIPAQYGGRLSSVMDLQMRDGNKKEFSGQGGIGPVTSRLLLEVPIVNDKVSLMVGGRATYSDWVLKQIPESTIKNSDASFADLLARVTADINPKNSVYFSMYYSLDKFKLTSDSLYSYHNILGSLQWRHTFNNHLYSVLSVTHSDYDYTVNFVQNPQNAFDFGFRIREYQGKYAISHFQGIHKLDYGIQFKVYDLNPGYLISGSSESTVIPVQVQPERGAEGAIFIANSFDLSPKVSLYAGLRYSGFSALGPRSINEYLSDSPRNGQTFLGTTTYDENEVINISHGPEYRLSARYVLPRDASVKLSYNRNRQYIHMLSNTVSVSPISTWKLSDPDILPEIADHVALGYYRNFKQGVFELSIETYYKWLENLIDYKTGSQLILNQNIEQDVLQGQGKAYGVELLLRKRSGKLNGWLAYTYARTLLKLQSQFTEEEINEGEFFPTNYDKPHEVSLISNYKITRRYSLSFNFNYSTGRPITYPIGAYKLGAGYKINYSDRNQFRIPDYVRIDVGFNLEGSHRIKKLAHSFWSFSIYNLLGRNNPYSIYFNIDSETVNGYKLSIFGSPIPTITYNFKF